MPTPHLNKENRIQEELKLAGISALGRHRFSAAHLPQVLHDDEHIEGAIAGQRDGDISLLSLAEGILVATNKRVIFLDCRPGFTTMDEISYNVVSGVNISTTTLSASVTLYTRISNYHLSHVGLKSARRFADYIETRIEYTQQNPIASEQPAPQRYEYAIDLDNKALDFLKKHEVGVLSTIERTGTLSGAAIYYHIRDRHPYFITKKTTLKVSNMVDNQHVALTVYDEQRLETVQITGATELVTDNDARMEVITAILRPRTYKDGSHEAPIIRMGADIETLVYRILVTSYNYIDFKNK